MTLQNYLVADMKAAQDERPEGDHCPNCLSIDLFKGSMSYPVKSGGLATKRNFRCKVCNTAWSMTITPNNYD